MRLVVRATLAVLLSSAGAAHAASAQLSATVMRQADSIAAAEFARDSVASLTIGIVTDRGLVWTKSYGYADIGARKLADRQTVYRIGSIAKMFTGLMAQQLAASGKVRLSDPVERYYPEIREIRGYSKLPAPITIGQLATMSSGIAREPREEGPFWTGPVSRWDSTLHLALPHTEIEGVPKSGMLYSNIGYAILGATLGRAAGMPFTEWQRTKILGPLGMRHTVFEIDSTIAATVSRGYEIGENGSFSSRTADTEAVTGRGYKVPNGALYTTIDDLSRFVMLQLGQGPDDVIARARLDSAFSGTLPGSYAPDSTYGLGFTADRGRYEWFGHNGGVAGFTAALMFDRKNQLGVITLRNATGGRVRPVAATVMVLQALERSK